MIRRWWWVIAVLVVIVAGALTYESPTSGDRVRVFFTTTVNGNLEPCGCPVNPSGGVARRAWVVKKDPPKGHTVLLLEGGDVVGPPSKKGLLQTEYLFRAMREMGYTVLGLGARDFTFGVEFLRAAQLEYGFTFTSANIVSLDNGDLVFPPFAIMKAGRGRIFGIPFGGTRVGVISVIGNDLQPLCPSCELTIGLLNAFDGAQRAARAIRGECDLVILFAYTDQSEIERLLTIPEVDVVIASRTLNVPRGFDNVGLHGHAALGYSAYEGRRLGVMDIERGPDGKAVKVEGDLLNLGTEVAEDPTITRIVEQYKRDVATLPAGEGHGTQGR